jgi:predicted nucleic acid-binding protein
MRRVCVDASLAVRWFVPEPGSAEALALLADWLDAAELWAPDLLYTECANAFRRKVTAGLMSRDDASDGLRELLGTEMRLVPDRESAEEALDAALQAGLTVWDASYVVVARRVEAELWTADADLHRLGQQAYPRIRLLEWPRPEHPPGR